METQTLLSFTVAALVLFFCVAVVVRLGAIARNTKKQAEHLEYLAMSARRANRPPPESTDRL